MRPFPPFLLYYFIYTKRQIHSSLSVGVCTRARGGRVYSQSINVTSSNTNQPVSESKRCWLQATPPPPTPLSRNTQCQVDGIDKQCYNWRSFFYKFSMHMLVFFLLLHFPIEFFLFVKKKSMWIIENYIQLFPLLEKLKKKSVWWNKANRVGGCFIVRFAAHTRPPRVTRLTEILIESEIPPPTPPSHPLYMLDRCPPPSRAYSKRINVIYEYCPSRKYCFPALSILFFFFAFI